jgi:hypothetical protein
MQYVRGRQTRFGQSGNIGGIPSEYVARKYSSTCLFEPEDLVREHFRDTLKDNTLEPPSLESDMPRYNHGAKDVLNIRYEGARSKVKPEHPGIYIANTTRDERGSQTQPNMRNHKEGMEFRIERYKDFVNDPLTDQSVTEGPWQPQQQIKLGQHIKGFLKKRLNWFETGHVANHTAHNQVHSTTSRMKLIKRDDDGNAPVISDMTSTLFTPSVVVLGGKSHKTKLIGRRKVPSHKFTVAKYGRAPSSRVYKYDTSNNMFNAVQTTEFKKSEENALRNLAIIMSGEAGKSCRPEANCAEKTFDGSTETMVTRHNGKHGDNRKTLDEMKHSQDFIEQMVVILESKSQRKQSIGDIKKQRAHKYIDPDIYSEVRMNKHVSVKMLEDPFIEARKRRKALTEIDGGGSMETAIYSMAVVPTTEQIHNAQRKGMIEYDNEESTTVYRGKSGPTESERHNTIAAVRATDETEFTEHAIAERLVGPMSEKSRIRRHVRYEPRGGLGDIASNHVK